MELNGSHRCYSMKHLLHRYHASICTHVKCQCVGASLCALHYNAHNARSEHGSLRHQTTMLALLSSSSHCCSGKFHAGLRRGFLGVERELNIECFVTTINTNAIFAIAETMPADDAKRASFFFSPVRNGRSNYLPPLPLPRPVGTSPVRTPPWLETVFGQKCVADSWPSQLMARQLMARQLVARH